jgi:hypothetical protein
MMEEEEAGCHRDRGANKEHMDDPYVISSSLPFFKILHNP